MRLPTATENLFVCVALLILLFRVHCFRSAVIDEEGTTRISPLSAWENARRIKSDGKKGAVPLNALKIQSVHSEGPMYEKGWDFYDTDLNAGSGGMYIYVGYKQGRKHPITSIDFKAYKTAQVHSLHGWKWSSQDLNNGSSGSYIYMYWKTGEREKQPITNLLFLATTECDRPAVPGYTAVGPDLNQDSGGKFIWAYYSNTAAPTSVEREKLK